MSFALYLHNNENFFVCLIALFAFISPFILKLYFKPSFFINSNNCPQIQQAFIQERHNSSLLLPEWSIIVLTYNRPLSLQRLLISLEQANYDADDIMDLKIIIDHPPPMILGNITHASCENSPTHKEWKNVWKLSQEFTWAHGKKIIQARSSNVGLRTAWLEAWYPVSDNEYAVLLEDDMELSPLWFKFAKKLTPELAKHHKLAALCLSPRSHRDFSFGEPLRFYKEHYVCSWGPVLFPRPWREFIDWAVELVGTEFLPIVPFSHHHNELARKKGSTIQSSWQFRFLFDHGYSTVVYCLSKNVPAMARNHQEAGVHYNHSHVPPLPSLATSNSTPIEYFSLPKHLSHKGKAPWSKKLQVVN